MLDYITGQKALNENLKFVADSGLYSETDDHNEEIAPLEQDHYMSDKNMTCASPKGNASQLKDYGQGKQHPSVSSLNYSLLSTSSSESDYNEEETTLHPDHYTAAQRTTISQSTSDCSNEVGQCSDHYNTLKQEGVVSEDGGVADDYWWWTKQLHKLL